MERQHNKPMRINATEAQRKNKIETRLEDTEYTYREPYITGGGWLLMAMT